MSPELLHAQVLTPEPLGVPEATSSVAFPDRKEVEVDFKALVRNMMEAQALKKEASASQEKAEVKIDTNLPWVLVVGSGDWHIGSEYTDYELFTRHMNLIASTPGVYVCIVGDERDNFVIPKHASGLFEGIASPQQQAQMVEHVLAELEDRGKILARVSGNHDEWTWMTSGIHLEDYWQNQMKSPLLRNGGFVHLRLNDKVEYVAFLHHGLSRFNSSFNPNHASKRAYEFMGRYDLMFSGHVHQAEVAHSWRGLDKAEHDYVQCRTGTYKRDDQYSRAMQLGKGQMPGACVLLNTQEKRMVPFLKLEDGVEALKALNTIYQLVLEGMLKVK